MTDDTIYIALSRFQIHGWPGLLEALDFAGPEPEYQPILEAIANPLSAEQVATQWLTENGLVAMKAMGLRSVMPMGKELDDLLQGMANHMKELWDKQDQEGGEE